ncbi:transposase zinc-binding domain-containing protein [Photobacterium sagamiensis]
METHPLRQVEIDTVTNMLACSTQLMGVREHSCSNPDCPHIKYQCQTCKGRGCPSCGKKATDQWIQNQLTRLPGCDWHHITFTMPDCLWSLFLSDRALLGALCGIATEYLLAESRRQGLVAKN